MDLRSTKKGLTSCITRFRGTRNVRTTGSFKGGIELGFSEWICNHWSPARPGSVHPVRKDFHKQKNPFELVRWPRPRRARVVHFTFSPTIRLELVHQTQPGREPVAHETFSSTMQLACLAERIANTTFEIGGARVRSSLTLQTNSPDRIGTNLLRTIVGPLTRESLQLPMADSSSTDQSIPGDRTLMVLEKRSSQDFLERNQQLQAMNLPDIISNSLVKVFRSARGWAGSLNVKAGSLLTSVKTFTSGSVFQSASAIHRTTLALQSLSQTRVLERLWKHPSLIGVKSGEFRQGVNVEAGSFTNLSLNFAAAGQSSTEMWTQRIAQFVNSPVLTYAKRESEISEKIVNALRDLRSSLSETKAVVAPQLPSIEHLTSQVRQQLERDLRIEKERRGL